MPPYYRELRHQPVVTAVLYDCFKQHVNPNNPLSYDIYLIKPSEFPEALLEYVSRAGLTIDNGKFFHAKPGLKSIIHRDADGRSSALNIPLTIGGLMTWYDNSWESVRKMEGQHVFLRMAAEHPRDIAATDSSTWRAAEVEHFDFIARANPEPAAKLVLTKPTCLAVDKWHKVDNDTNADRIIFTMRFKENPSLQNMVDAFASVPQL